MQEHEHEELVPYLGKQVPRRGFRAFIYASDGRQKIAESYDEFDLFTHSDEWFATKRKQKHLRSPVKKRRDNGLHIPRLCFSSLPLDKCI